MASTTSARRSSSLPATSSICAARVAASTSRTDTRATISSIRLPGVELASVAILDSDIRRVEYSRPVAPSQETTMTDPREQNEQAKDDQQFGSKHDEQDAIK